MTTNSATGEVLTWVFDGGVKVKSEVDVQRDGGNPLPSYNFTNLATSGNTPTVGTRQFGGDSLTAKSHRTSSVKSEPGTSQRGGGNRTKANNNSRRKAGLRDGELSPRSLAQREKNREAVRKCRKRKKAHAMELRERAIQLEEENTKLRMQLQLGSEDVRREKTEQGEKLVNEMASLVDATGSDAEAQLRRAVTLYVERYQDHGRDRQAATGYILSRLKRLVSPARTTRMYLWQMAQPEDEYFADPQSMWKEMCKELNLTESQEQHLLKRRPQARLLRSEFAYAENKMQRMRHMIRRNKKVGDAFTDLLQILQPRQFAKFVLWVHNDPGCKDILDKLWDSVLEQCDEQIDSELAEQQDDGNEGLVKMLKGARNDCLALIKNLFECSKPTEVVKLVRMCFDPEVNLVDPNNGGELVGHDAVVQYINRIQRAFSRPGKSEALKAQLKEMVVDEFGKGHGCWRLTGGYNGKWATMVSSRKRQRTPGQSSPASSSTVSSPTSLASGGNHHGNIDATEDNEDTLNVAFDVVIQFSFAQDSERIREMVISWDAMSLVKQLGLMDKMPQALPIGADGSAVENTPQQSAAQADDDDLALGGLSAEQKAAQEAAKERLEIEKKCKGVCLKLVKLFELSSSAISREASAVLDPLCVFIDAHIGGEYNGVAECVKYLKGIKSTFPEMIVTPKFVSSNSAGDGDVQVDEGNVPVAHIDPATNGMEFHMDWSVNGKYGGSLVRHLHDCTLNADVFVSCCPNTLRILSAQFSFNAADLMHQLGILHDSNMPTSPQLPAGTSLG